MSETPELVIIDVAEICAKQEEWIAQLQQIQAEHQKLDRHIATLEGAIQACQVFIDINTKQE